MSPFSLEFRGRPISYWKAPESRFTVVGLPDFLTPSSWIDSAVVDQLLQRSLNVLIPSLEPLPWMDRADPSFHSQLTAERFLVELLTDPTLPVPRAPMAAIGGEGAVRLGLKYPSLLPVAASWDGIFDIHDWYGRGTKLDALFERPEQARQHTACLQVRQHDCPPFIWFGCPLDSERYRGNDRLHEKLNAVGISHEYVVAETCPIAPMLDFVSNGLEKQSRRLL